MSEIRMHSHAGAWERDIPRVSMLSFRHGLAESSHREVKGGLSTGVECDPDAATDSQAAVLGTGFRQSLAE